MHRLNPTQNVDDEVFMGFFPPTDEYYTDQLQDKTFINFLMSDGTTKEGQERIADLYQVTQMWDVMEKSEHVFLAGEGAMHFARLNDYTVEDDSYFYELLSKAYAKEGKELLQYQAQSEAYYRKFNLPRAIEQMEFAVKSKDGNFYQKSIVESRLKQLKFENSLEDIKDKK